MEPILLFSVKKNGKAQGVYYAPQYGVVMRGLVNYGSLRQVAKHLSSGFEHLKDGAVKLSSMEEDEIIRAVAQWMKNGEEPADPVEDKDDWEAA